MNCRLPKVALLLAVVVLAAYASQPTLKVTQVNPATGALTQTSFDRSSSTAPRAPQFGKYWDGVASTNYYNTPTSIINPGGIPNPQIAVGPDDVIVIANRNIARWPNPNALGNSLVLSPYNNPPTSLAFLDNWLGITNLNTLCPTLPRNTTTCVIDNASIRYDQLQGRFVVLFTVTDVPARVSNFALIVSKFATFNNIANVNTSALFTTPVQVPTTGGVPTGGLNATNWIMYNLSINVTLAAPITKGTAYAGAAFCAAGSAAAGPITAGCSNYFPTGARLGDDNDNIILTAPVLDQSQSPSVGGAFPQPPGGPYAGTRVVTLPKLVVYNASSLPIAVPPGCAPSGCGAINLSDDTATGTLTGTTGNPVPTRGLEAPNPIPSVFWEPNNLRGRALANFNSQVLPAAGSTAGGIISPIDFLVGTLITHDYGLSPGSNVYYVQPIVFSCPASAIYSAPAGVTFCGTFGGGQVPDASILGPLRTNASTIATMGDPALVGQGGNVTTPPAANSAMPRLFVGDSRPQQVIYREGLLYVARALRFGDLSLNSFGTSTVLYNILSQGAPTAYSNTGATLPFPANILETEWLTGGPPDPNGYGFYAPMFDVPANVISSGPTSPINLFPWLEKLFVGMTTGDTANLANTFNGNHPSLWDFRPGDDAYDTTMPYLDPYTGAVITTVPGYGTAPFVSLSTRGGATTDPNDGSLWLSGAFAKYRNGGIPGPGVWGTSMANYQLDFPAVDPYGNANAFFADVPATQQFFTWIQIAKNAGIAAASSTTAANCTAPPAGSNPPITPPPGPGGTGGSSQVCSNFSPAALVTRAEMSRWVVLAQMTEAQVTAYLNATGGDPSVVGPTASSFADDLAGLPAVPGTATTACTSALISNSASLCFGQPSGSAVNPSLTRYIEVMYRRGYTKGCGFTNDGRRMYCPSDNLTRGQMSVFLIRAKMNNVFPTTLSGIPLSAPYGDNFGLFQPSTPYFTDEPTSDGFFIYIQKMRELRITNGTGTTTFSPNSNLTRQEIATFIVRAFFL